MIGHMLLALFAASLTVANASVVAADCLAEVEKTKAQMQSPEKSPGKPARNQGKAANPPEPPSESWQGGSQSEGSTSAKSQKPAENPEAKKWLGIATTLAQNGKTGGCWQTLVQAKRILGLIPADTPLPDVPPG